VTGRGYRRPRTLSAGDAVEQFQCRSAEQSAWLRHYARQANATGTGRVHVVTEVGSDPVVAYYA
jgi:hypothetical protein